MATPSAPSPLSTPYPIGVVRWHRLAQLAAVTLTALVAVGCGGETDGQGSGGVADDPDKRLAALNERLGDAAEHAREAGCSLSAPELREPEHVTETSRRDWSSNPPSSGPHFEEWAPFGFYDEPVEDGYVVHNLEHGGVALWYDPQLAAQRTTMIEQELLDSGEKWIVVPREDVDGIATAAWGVLMECDTDALESLDDQELRELLDAWYAATNSQGTEQEKDIPAYPGGMEEPAPERDISVEPPQ